jgi:hypothetical protein
MPTEFSIDIFSHSDLANYLSIGPTAMEKDVGMTYQTYARIRARRTGILTPGTSYVEPPNVTFHIILEELVLGLIPASLIPTLVFAAGVVGAVGMLVPRLNSWFEKIAVEARAELVKKAQ